MNPRNLVDATNAILKVYSLVGDFESYQSVYNQIILSKDNYFKSLPADKRNSILQLAGRPTRLRGRINFNDPTIQTILDIFLNGRNATDKERDALLKYGIRV